MMRISAFASLVLCLSLAAACIAVAGPIELSAMIETRTGNRELNMWSFASAALDLLVKAIEQAGGDSAGTQRT